MSSSDDDSFHSVQALDTPEKNTEALPSPSSSGSSHAIQLSVSTSRSTPCQRASLPPQVPSAAPSPSSDDSSVVESSICGSPASRNASLLDASSSPLEPFPTPSNSQPATANHDSCSSVQVLSGRGEESDGLVIPETQSSGSPTSKDSQSPVKVEGVSELAPTAPFEDSAQPTTAQESSKKGPVLSALVGYDISSDEEASSDDSDTK
jgi:hypothetical protein